MHREEVDGVDVVADENEWGGAVRDFAIEFDGGVNHRALRKRAERGDDPGDVLAQPEPVAKFLPLLHCARVSADGGIVDENPPVHGTDIHPASDAGGDAGDALAGRKWETEIAPEMIAGAER